MMRLVAVLLVAFAGGCMGSVHLRGGRSGLEGFGLGAEGPVAKLRVGTEAIWKIVRGADSDKRHGVFGYDVTLRGGVVSAILEGRCEDDQGTCGEAPRFDLGPGVGVGAALTGELDLVGHAWIGGWADVRVSSGESYWVIRAELQRDGYSGEVRGDTQVVLGIGYVDWNWSFK